MKNRQLNTIQLDDYRLQQSRGRKEFRQAQETLKQTQLKNLRNYNRRSAKEIVGKWSSLLTELEKAGQSKIFSVEELVNLSNESMEE